MGTQIRTDFHPDHQGQHRTSAQDRCVNLSRLLEDRATGRPIERNPQRAGAPFFPCSDKGRAPLSFHVQTAGGHPFFFVALGGFGFGFLGCLGRFSVFFFEYVFSI